MFYYNCEYFVVFFYLFFVISFIIISFDGLLESNSDKFMMKFISNDTGTMLRFVITILREIPYMFLFHDIFFYT